MRGAVLLWRLEGEGAETCLDWRRWEMGMGGEMRDRWWSDRIVEERNEMEKIA